MAANNDPRVDLIPADIHEACKILGWTPIAARTYGNETGYLIDDGLGLTEPYSRRAIISEANARLRARRQREIRRG